MAEDPATGGAAPAVAPSLTRSERRRTWQVGALAAGLVFVAILVLALTGRATLLDVALGTLVYGGLLGLAAGVVVHERLQAAHCPACDATGPLRRRTCGACGYDLAARPLYRCAERHRRYVEPGLCDCGRRLVRLERIRGLDREIRRTLWAGAWVAAFLLGVALLLGVVG